MRTTKASMLSTLFTRFQILHYALVEYFLTRNIISYSGTAINGPPVKTGYRYTAIFDFAIPIFNV